MDVSLNTHAEMSATAKVNLDTQWAGARVLLFNLDSNFRVDKVTDGDGKGLTFFQARERKDRPQSYGDYVAVMLETPAKAGKRYR